jgi:hypothetical protein
VADSTRKPVGYVTGYRDAAGRWWVSCDGPPFTTLGEALGDVVDACNEMPGVDWRALTVYDKTGEPYYA